MTAFWRRKGFWNLPNGLTVLRIAVIPVMVWILWEVPTFPEAVASCAIFVGAMITDVIDGWLARKWGLESPMGAYLDPLADKLMVATVLIMMVPLGWLPAWMVALLICREMAITGLRGIASQEGIMLKADAFGKLKTAYQSVALGFLLWHYETLGCDGHSAGLVLMWIALVVSLVSAVLYFHEFLKKTRVTA